MPTAQEISESSTVKLGLVVLLCGWIATSAWWASKQSTKLDMVLTNQATLSSDLVALAGRTVTLERSTDMFTQVGSPALRPRIEALEKSVNQLILVGSMPTQDLAKRVTIIEQRVEHVKQ